MVWYTWEQCVFLYDTYLKHGSARKCRGYFRRKFRDERVPSRQTIHNLVNKLRSTGLLIDKNQKHECRVLTEKKLDNTEARREHKSRKSLKRLAQETGVSTSNARRATQLLKLRSYKTTVTHALQPLDPAIRVHFCSCILWYVVEGEIDLQLTGTPPVICE
jgi:transposase